MQHNPGSSDNARKMISEFSSPSSSSAGTGSSASPKDPKGPYLYIKKEPPGHVFVGEDFEFYVAIANAQSNREMSITVSAVATDPVNIHLLETPHFEADAMRVYCSLHSSGISQHHGVSLSLRVGIAGSTSLSCHTRTVSLVNSKIVLSEPPGCPWEEVWYKDEGGRDRGIEVIASLIDRNMKTVKHLKVPLQLTLCYNSDPPTPVSNQDLLRSLRTIDKYKIDETTGFATVRFRIEDVSKNHQGQEFCVQVAADPKKHQDIAPGYTPSVSVRSKRNKRARVANKPSISGSERSSASPTMSRRESMGLESEEAKRLRLAVSEVSRWAAEVVNSLAPLQWNVLGYAQFPDGSLDYSRPYHSMPNPNGTISRILSSYDGSTREHLRILQESLGSPAPMPPYHPAPYFHPAVPLAAPSNMSMYPRQQRLTPPTISRAEGDRHQYGSHPNYTLEPSHVELPRTTNLQTEPSKETRISGVEEENVEYVLAKQYKSIHSGDHLGFPAFSASKDLIGFFRETGVGAGTFTPISQYANDFGKFEMMQATDVLNQAIVKKTPALHCRKDWLSLSQMIDQCIVYDFSNTMESGEGPGDPSR